MQDPEPTNTATNLFDDSTLSDEQRVDAILRQFDTMSHDEQREVMALMFNVDPTTAAIVRRPDGLLAMKEVSPGARQKIEQMARQGFQAATFTNRKQRRAEQVLARRKAKARPASAG